jgi:DNA-binding beta-propeller fold protein YncE
VKSVLLVLAGGVAIGCASNKPCDRTVVGNVCTIAGTGENGYSGEGGPALDANFSLPMDTVVAPDGSLYIADWNNHRIRQLTSDGIVHFIAGNGELGGSLDDPTNGDFNHPTGLLFDSTGTKLYISAWHNSKVLILDLPSGGLIDSCGTGARSYTGDEGPGLKAALNLPASIAWDPQGQLTILDEANQVIRNIDSAGNIHRIAGQCVIDEPVSAGGPGPCDTPTACPAPSDQTTCGSASATCGMLACAQGYGGDEGPALQMRMSQAFGQQADPGGRIVFDPAGNLYFADTTNDLIRKIDTNGIVHRVAGTPPSNGAAQAGYAGDGGPALDALLDHPIDLAFDEAGTLYFSDVYNHCIRAIATDGTISTVAGVCGTKGYRGDGGAATKALFDIPYGVEYGNGVLYIADTGNNVIRAVRLKAP